MRKNTILKSTMPALAMSAALVLGLSGCGQSGSQSSASEPSASSSSASVDASASLTFDDAWVKAADEGMTGIFGKVTNTTDADINLVGANYDGANMVQLHETVGDGSGSMMMQEKDGGFVIPAGGSLDLEPGGDHIMVMDMTRPIKPGEEITVELVTADDETISVTAVAKEYTGAQETYAPGEPDAASDGGDGMEGMSDDGMGDMSGMSDEGSGDN